MRHHHALLFCTLAACAAQDELEAIDETEAPVVYGEDHRRDVYDHPDQAWARRAAEFTAAMMDSRGIDRSNPAAYRFGARTLRDSFGVCPDERFASQITAAGCSATLIAPDLVLTAGHCIDAGGCSGTVFVFDYYMTGPSTLQTVTADDVYRCAQVVSDSTGGFDYAVVRLDRTVVGRTPAPVDATPAALPVGTPLVVNGYGSGLPLKIDDGARVRDGRAGAQDTFVANLDTFGGNSGSGVFRKDTGKLVGILVSGETDYVRDGNCQRVNRCPDGGCGGENSTYAHRAITALCAVSPDPTLCVSRCGDGVCSAGETAASCPADCSGPQPGGGETCSDAIALAVSPSVRVSGATSGARDDVAGTCVGGGAPDRVYSFTLSRAMNIEAIATGYDTGLHLRTGCGSGSELACNDDATPPGGLGSRLVRRLDPGTYYLVVDGYGSSSGAYELSVAFTN